MLVLTRKENESIIINDNIEVVILGIEDGKVRLGINAPKDLEIHRKEVYQLLQNENKEASISKDINIEVLKEVFLKNKE